jgi:VIT1/CCC1 family predicted Fe2+/Mn2+ transporter
MAFNKDQREATSKTLLDIGKIVLASFAVGGLIPSSPIGIIHIVAATIISILLYIASMILLKGD